MTQCPQCGNQLRPGARFCRYCGPAAGQVCPGCGADLRPEARFCRKCRLQAKCLQCEADLRPGARFCPKCRAPVAGTQPPVPIPVPSTMPPAPLPPPDPAYGVCANGHPQRRVGAKFCYLCQQPVLAPGQAAGPMLNGRYQILDELGRGGLGSVVYKVRDTQETGRILAVKEMDEVKLRQEPTNSEEDIEHLVLAFRREAEMLNELDHPHIVKVYEYFQDETRHYMAMDMVEGKTIGKLLETSPDGFPEARVLPWAEQLCDALDYLHSLTPPVIYRDMKPENIMIEDGSNTVKMIDFGIARQYKGGKKKQDTIKFGTPGYAAPEQYGTSGTETSPASDVYSLAAMLYQLLTGQDPADNPLFFFDKSKLLDPAVAASPQVADALEHALQTEIAKRCPSMAEFARGLTGKRPDWQKKRGAGSGAPEPAKKAAPKKAPKAKKTPKPQSSLTVVQLSTHRLDLGEVEKGATTAAHKSFTVLLSGGGRAQLKAKEPWISLSQTSVSNSQSVSVSVLSDELPLGHLDWDAPGYLGPAFRFLVRKWLLGVGLLAALFIPVAGPLLLLALIAAVAIQLALWLVSWFLRRVVVRTAALRGEVSVSSGRSQQSLSVYCRAVPSAWRRLTSWGALVVATAAELGAFGVGAWVLIDQVFYWSF